MPFNGNREALHPGERAVPGAEHVFRPAKGLAEHRGALVAAPGINARLRKPERDLDRLRVIGAEARDAQRVRIGERVDRPLVVAPPREGAAEVPERAHALRRAPEGRRTGRELDRFDRRRPFA